MAEVETDETEMLVDGTESDITGKLISKQELSPNQNGLDTDDGGSNDEKPVSHNGVSDNSIKEKREQEDVETEVVKLSDRPLENGDIEKDETDTPEHVKDSVSAKSGDTPVVLSDNPDSDVVESVGSSNSPVIVNSDASQDENSSEAMEVDSKDDDDDSNVVELSSIVSAPNSDVVEVGNNNSNNPSLISEESSQDSIDSNESIKSGNSSESKQKDSLTVKGDDGDEILITLNDEDDGEKEKVDVVEKSPEKEIVENKQDCENPKSEKKENTEENKGKIVEKKKESPEKTANVEVSKAAATIQPASAITAPSVPTATTLLFPVATGPLSSPQNIVVQGPVPSIRAEYQLMQQGNQLGYISIVGNQRVFVPVSSAVQTAVPKNSMIANQLSAVQPQPQKKGNPLLKGEDLQPKASWEMIELMRWEIQNRIPDNYNWSVAFHGRKEEVSSLTSFLQELGSDVVKEQVYKDIIQIQTKKKEAGDLKAPEIESLEKMKTVYENTKKKVEHLQLETKECKTCKFKTESKVVMNYHDDFPHYDPPWDTNKGWLLCAHCDFKTKTPAHFIFHQKDIHKVQAKFLEKNQYFHCSLCPLSVSTKAKLEKHQQKCMKHFKLNANLQPYYHDVNFCMKTCYFKPKKVVPKPVPPPKPVVTKPTMLTRQQGSVPVVQAVSQQNQPIRPTDTMRQRLPLVRAQLPQQNIQRPQVQLPRPRLNPPTLQRAPIPQQQKPLRPAGREMSGFEVCELCGGYVKDRQALRIHFYYAHKVEMPQAIFNRPTPPLTCEVCKQHYWTTQGLTKHKTAQRHFIGARPSPAVGKIAPEQECFMCLKRFPNLFVHFERIHGMTMKDLVLVRKCIMCGLAASDYKSLETHLVNAHGVLIKVSDYVNDRSKIVRPQSTGAPIIGGGKNVGKINYCVFCQIQFPDNIQLTMHCIRVHATCSTCGMVVATGKNLAEHSCSKAHINRSCYICGAKVASQEKYAFHLRSHVKACRVKIQNMTGEEIEAVKNKIKREYKPAVISLDSDEDSDIEVVETKPNKMKVVLEKEESKDVEMVDLSVDTDEKSVKNEKNTDTADSKKQEEKNKESEICEKVKEEHDVKSEKFKKENDQDSEMFSKDKLDREFTKTDKQQDADESERQQDADESESSINVEQDKNSEEGKENSEGLGNVKEEGNFEKDRNSEEGKENSGLGNVKKEGNFETDNKTLEEVESRVRVEQDIRTETAEASARNSEIQSELNEDVDSNIKSQSTCNEFVSKNSTENLNEGKETESANEMELNNPSSVENEKELEDKLLAKDDDEDSIGSTGSRKRKKSESDIDEDELLRDNTTDAKRIKIEDEHEDNDKSVNDQNDGKNDLEKTGNEDGCVKDVEIGETSSVGDKKIDEI